VGSRRQPDRYRVVLDFDEALNPTQSSWTAYRDGEVIAIHGFWSEPFDTARTLPAAAVRALDTLIGQGAVL